MEKIKNLILPLILAAMLFSVWWLYESKQNGNYEASKMKEFETIGVPDFQVSSLDESKVLFSAKASKYDGKVLIINFWASWCAPCVTEFPSILKFAENYKDKVQFVAISVDNTTSEIKNFLNAYQLDTNKPNIEVYWAASRVQSKQFGTDKLPESYIIKNGKLIKKVIGGISWESKEFTTFFEKSVGI